jgi:putative transcriptional regulator
MKNDGHPISDLSGSVLVSHPALTDPNFRRTILFITHHDPESGAAGYVLNRPLDSRLPVGTGNPDQSVELFYGGPVEANALTLVSLQWRKPQGILAFHSFELTGDKIPGEWSEGLRAFAGYSGWGAGQLESEIQHKAWLVFPPSEALITLPNPREAWQEIMRKSGSLLALLAAAPDDPSLN